MAYTVALQLDSLHKFAELYSGSLEGTIEAGDLTVLIIGRRRKIAWSEPLVINQDGQLNAMGDKVLMHELVSFLTSSRRFDTITIFGLVMTTRKKLEIFADEMQQFGVRIVAIGSDQPGTRGFMCYQVETKNDRTAQPALLIIDGKNPVEKYRAFFGDRDR